METKKITIYEKHQVGTSIDVLKQIELRKEGKRPLGIASIRFDEAIGGAIYYTIDRVIFFDTVRITVINDFQQWNYCVYRIAGNNLIYDPIYSKKGSLEKGAITDIRFLNVKEEETYIFYTGEEYKGKI